LDDTSDRNEVDDEVRGRINSGEVCYYSTRKLLIVPYTLYDGENQDVHSANVASGVLYL